MEAVCDKKSTNFGDPTQQKMLLSIYHKVTYHPNISQKQSFSHGLWYESYQWCTTKNLITLYCLGRCCGWIYCRFRCCREICWETLQNETLQGEMMQNETTQGEFLQRELSQGNLHKGDDCSARHCRFICCREYIWGDATELDITGREVAEWDVVGGIFVGGNIARNFCRGDVVDWDVTGECFGETLQNKKTLGDILDYNSHKWRWSQGETLWDITGEMSLCHRMRKQWDKLGGDITEGDSRWRWQNDSWWGRFGGEVVTFIRESKRCDGHAIF